MFVIEFIVLGIGAIFSLFLLYYVFLAVAGFWPGSARQRGDAPKKRYTIIVPAHNEESVIGDTLQSLGNISYPKDLYRVLVVADNCDDRTVEIVKGAGLECLERHDRANPGKGQALEWAFKKILKTHGSDAFIIVDADTIVDPNILNVMNGYLAGGARVVQAYYDVLKPASSPMASLTFLGFAISRNLKYRGRSRLGFSVNLLGNGMCITREIIERFGWRAFSISEDLEYQLQLLLEDVPVVFAPETKVWAEMPSRIKSYHTQRSRWDVGKYKLRNKYVPLLLAKGLRELSPACLDAVLELIIPPYLLYAGATYFFYVMYLLLFYNGIDTWFCVWTALAGGLTIYTLSGLMIAHASFRVYVNLVYAPLFLVQRLAMVFESLLGSGKKWVKTERM